MESFINNYNNKYVNNLSLAQKLGLVDRPDLPLGLKEWKLIE